MGQCIIARRGINTSDATATAAEILAGYTAYVKGGKLTGTLTLNRWEKYSIKTVTTYNWSQYGGGGGSEVRVNLIEYDTSLPKDGVFRYSTYASSVLVGKYFRLWDNPSRAGYVSGVSGTSISYSSVWGYSLSSETQKDAFVGYVYSSKGDTFPTNGIENGYWYVKQ